MHSPLKSAQEALLQLWEQAVQLHQHIKTEPSMQCALSLVKVLIRLAFLLAKLYIESKIL